MTVIEFPSDTRAEVPVERVLDNARHLESVLVLGFDGDDEHFASSSADKMELLWLLERCKARILAEED